jgi:hypothetical protein
MSFALAIIFLHIIGYLSTNAASQFCPISNCFSHVQFPLYQRYSSGALVSHYFPSVGLNISIPSDWIRSPKIQSINEIAMYNAPFQGQSDKFSENLVIKKGRYENNLSSTAYSNATLVGLEKLPKFQLQERDDEFALGDFQANKFRYSYSSNRQQYMSMQVGLIAGSAYITLTYNAELGRYAEYVPTIDKILSSVKINESILSEIPEIDTIVFVDKPRGISVKYPSDWIKADGDYLGSIVTLLAPLEGPSDFYFDNIRIYSGKISQTNSTTSLKSIVKDVELKFEKTLRDFKVLGTMNDSVSNSPALSINYTFTGNDGYYHKILRSTFLLKSTQLYYVIYDSTNDSFEKYLPSVRRVLASLSIT